MNDVVIGNVGKAGANDSQNRNGRHRLPGHSAHKNRAAQVDRGEGKVIRKLANNAGAQFSDQGFSSIVARAGADDELVEITPKSVRLRKRYLKEHERKRSSK